MKGSRDYFYLVANGGLTYIPEAFIHLSREELGLALLIGGLINEEDKERNFRNGAILVNELSKWFARLEDLRKGWGGNLNYLREFAEEHGYPQGSIDNAIIESCERDNNLPIHFS